MSWGVRGLPTCAASLADTRPAASAAPPQEAVLRFFIALVIISLLYLVYGVHAAQFHDDDLDNRRACAPGPGPAAMTAPRAPREWGGAGARQLF